MNDKIKVFTGMRVDVNNSIQSYLESNPEHRVVSTQLVATNVNATYPEICVLVHIARSNTSHTTSV